MNYIRLMAITNECNCNCNTGATDATVRRVYYKDDLDFYMTLIDCDDENIGVPDFDWRARLWTSSKMNYVTVSSIGGELTNCRIDDGRIHVIVDSHHLMPGKLHIDFEALIPNELYPDGTRRTVVPGIVPIELTADKAPCPSAMEIELMLPYVRGKALTFDDLTAAEKDAFAQSAADRVTIENLGVASDEEVDEAMGELLDTPPATMKEKTFYLDRRIRRGIMPAKARPGIVYYDRGLIKIKPWRNINGVLAWQSEWDITALTEYIDSMNIFAFHEICDIDIVRHDGYVEDLDSKIAERDGRVILTLDYNPNHILHTYWLALDGFDVSGPARISEYLRHKPIGVMYIDKDGLLKRLRFQNGKIDSCLLASKDFAEYSPNVSDRELDMLSGWIGGEPPYGFEAKRWKFPHIKIKEGNFALKRRFCKVTKYAKRASGLYAVRIKSNKGYHSKWRKVIIAHDRFYKLI